MNRVSRALNTVVVVGSTSVASPEGIFRSSRGEKAAIDQHYREVSSSAKNDKVAEKIVARVGRRESIVPKLGGDKLNYAQRGRAPSAAILVRPGEHVPVDFGSEYLTPMSPELEQWANAGKTAADLLMWFEATPEGKASLESLERLREQARLSAKNVMDPEVAIHGDEKTYSNAVNAAMRNDDAVRQGEKAHFDRAHAKHMLAKPKEESKGNTAKVIKSVIDELIRPGEHLPARATPAELRKIGVDNRGNLTGKPSADRVRDVAGNLVLVEPIVVSAEDLADDKKVQQDNKIQKTSDKLGAQIRNAENKIAFLSKEVARLESDKASDNRFGDKQAKDLARLSTELKGAQSHLATLMEPIKGDVRIRGVKVITDQPSAHKVGTRVCARHEGRLNCKCHLRNFEVTVIDGQRNIVRRSKVAL